MSQAFRILILCTGNSARSQIAEALVRSLGRDRIEVASAGSHPARAVNPLAVAVLHEVGIEWQGRVPRPVAGLEREHWDLVITVCDHARDACPVFPHARVSVHWGMEDPYRVLQRRVQSLLALPLATMSDGELARDAQAIGDRQNPDGPEGTVGDAKGGS